VVDRSRHSPCSSAYGSVLDSLGSLAWPNSWCYLGNQKNSWRERIRKRILDRPGCNNRHHHLLWIDVVTDEESRTRLTMCSTLFVFYFILNDNSKFVSSPNETINVLFLLSSKLFLFFISAVYVYNPLSSLYTFNVTSLSS